MDLWTAPGGRRWSRLLKRGEFGERDDPCSHEVLTRRTVP
jgi:hypothetical protein